MILCDVSSECSTLCKSSNERQSSLIIPDRTLSRTIELTVGDNTEPSLPSVEDILPHIETEIGEDRREKPFRAEYRQRRKSIRFADPPHAVAALIPPHYELSPSERDSTWWGQRDFAQFRKDAQAMATFARENDPMLRSGTFCAYAQARYYAAVFCTTEDDCNQVMQQPQCQAVEKLASWSAKHTSLRGLEHWLSRSHQEARRGQIATVKTTVLTNAGKKLSADQLADLVATSTRTSRILARLWGEADARVAAGSVGYEKFDVSKQIPQKTQTVGRKFQGLKLPVQHRGIA